MGVHSLWELITPLGQSVKIETLRNKRLAIDASIWIYQFMIALGDSNKPNPHIWGFFKRICKLLFLGIRPIFVFDGKPPALKVETIRRRKLKGAEREEEIGDAKMLAKRILSRKLQREVDEQSPTKKKRRTIERKEHQNMASMVDSEEGAKESILFKAQDDYHLPHKTEIAITEGDQRFSMDNEYDKLTQEVAIDLDEIDLDKIDPQGEDFKDLPLTTQYIILSHLRLRSRLRMGYTKEQLKDMFPDPLEFSKFQISMVSKRNFLTQKLMNVSGMDSDDITSGRLASDTNRVYQLERLDQGYSMKLEKKPVEDNYYKGEFDELDDDIDWNDHVHDEIKVKDEHIDNEKNKKPDQSDGLFISEEGKNNSGSESDMDFEDVEPLKEDSKEDNGANIEDIKQLYEYAAKNNNPNSNHDAALDDQIEWLQQIELKRAIEESKQDLINLSHGKDTGKDVPIILTKHGMGKSTLFKSLGMKVDFSKNKLFNKHKEDEKKEQRTVIEMEDVNRILEKGRDENEQEEEKPKSKPLPDWFQSSNLEGWQIKDRKEEKREEENEYYGISKELEDDSEKQNENATNTNEIVIDLDSPIEKEAEEIVEINSSSPTSPSTPPVQDIEENEEEFEIIESESESPVLASSNSSSPVIEPEALEEPSEQIEEITFEKQPSEVLENAQDQNNKEKETVTVIPNVPTKLKSNDTPFTINSMSFFDDVATKEPSSVFTSKDITPEMMTDIHTLLRILGIPYITAPEEAEAQCCELEQLGLADGIISDDCDCFLFGGQSIYKNMFADKSGVEFYSTNAIEGAIGLGRQEMIDLAVLLGSDYCLGVRGVGKVMAMEILGDFGSLETFAKWWRGYQEGKLGVDTPIRAKIRAKLGGKFFIGDKTWPPKELVNAYEKPIVDHSEESFKWGQVDVEELNQFLQVSLRWDAEQTMDVLRPVLENMAKPRQRGLDEFYASGKDLSKRVSKYSKRVKDSIEKLKRIKQLQDHVESDSDWDD